MLLQYHLSQRVLFTQSPAAWGKDLWVTEGEGEGWGRTKGKGLVLDWSCLANIRTVLGHRALGSVGLQTMRHCVRVRMLCDTVGGSGLGLWPRTQAA